MKMLHDKQVPALTGLRGVGALLVVAYHLHSETLSPFQDLFKMGGEVGLKIFFCLSGYLLAHIYCDAIRAAPMEFMRDYRSFIGKRIARIYPLHIFMLILVLIFLPHYHDKEDGLQDLFMNLTLTQGWFFNGDSFVGAAWSISVEFLFYLVFPFMVLLTNRGLSLFVFIVLGAAYTNQGLFPEEWWPYLSHRVFYYGVFFIFGVSVFYLSQYRLVRVLLDNNFAFVVLSGLLFLVSSGAYSFSQSFIFCAITFSVPFLVRSSHTSEIGNYLLSGVVIVWIGELSYSIYLSHQIIYQILIDNSHAVSAPLYKWGSFYILLLIWALFCYHLIEVPARKKLRGVIGQ